MSGVSGRSSPSWREAATATGFGILCIKDEKGEWFTVSAVHERKRDILADVGLRPGVMVPEAELLQKLALTMLWDLDNWLIREAAPQIADSRTAPQREQKPATRFDELTRLVPLK